MTGGIHGHKSGIPICIHLSAMCNRPQDRQTDRQTERQSRLLSRLFAPLLKRCNASLGINIYFSQVWSFTFNV